MAPTQPFRSQKDTNWGGARGEFRRFILSAGPGKIEAGLVLNGICSHQGHAADGCWRRRAIQRVSQKLLTGYKVGDKTFKVHIDGVNLLPYLTGQVKESPRRSVLLRQR